MGIVLRVNVQSVVSKTAPFTGATIDVSEVNPGLSSVSFHVLSFDSNQTARLQLSDSLDNFVSDDVALHVVNIQGGLTRSNDLVVKLPWWDIPGARWGVTDAKMRVSLTNISGGTLTYEAWIDDDGMDSKSLDPSNIDN